MSHLPECPSVNYFGLHERTACICRYLRACEERVQETNIHSLLRQEDMRIGIKKGRTAQFKEMKMQVKDAAKEAYAFGYAAALDAAEAAVTLDVVNRGLDAYDDEFFSRTGPHPDGTDSICYECNKERAVTEIHAALRALQEKP